MQFRTELTPDKLPVPLQLTDRIVTVGSCFAEVMGRRLAEHKLAVLTNPLGTLFNPFSISRLLTVALTGNVPERPAAAVAASDWVDDLNAGYVQRDGLWFHYDFHSSVWANSREELAELIRVRLAEVGEALRQADMLLLTLGTAVVHYRLDTGREVANCHKMPGTLFGKELSRFSDVQEELSRLLGTLRGHNPDLRVVLTVSPVRHVRDGLTLNSASKSLLRLVCHEVAGTFPNVHYFPAYELMNDDLRDYRFYEADLIHPNAQAHDYIFGKFADSAFSPDLRAFMEEWSAIRRAMQHRPLHGMTAAHRRFLQTLLNRFDSLPVTIDTTAERAEIQRQLL